MKKILLPFIFSLATSMLLLVLACQTNSPNSPISNADRSRSSDHINFLTPQNATFAKSMVSEQYIHADKGGTILVGDEQTGYSSIHFMPGDLSQDVIITFSWDAQDHIAELSPHGLVFNNPVALNLSFGNANLAGMNEDDLQIWYFNETENAWELIGGEVNHEEKRVEGFIHHFSKYALAGGGN